mmetsp:Transcript_36065/g.83898  ORF Transcript_36065/g.83898 Transcript_36065/m.83898 type:complete len:201 (-) Transcript_36065:927-1529(-)
MSTCNLWFPHRSHINQVGLLHGAQRCLVSTEDSPKENIVRHATLGRTDRQNPHCTPQLRPGPFRARLAHGEQCAHVRFGRLDELADSVSRRIALVEIRYKRSNVTETAANSCHFVVTELWHSPPASLEMALEDPRHGLQIRIAELMHCQAFWPVLQCSQHGRLSEGVIRDEEHPCKSCLGDVVCPCDKNGEEALAAILVL